MKNHIEIERDLPETPLSKYIDDHWYDLVNDFIDQFPPEERPLDDDGPDFIDNNYNEFEAFAKSEMENEKHE